jgi:asparagine synthase (glutamine-hydrolysing)
MCGIAGIVSKKESAIREDILQQMVRRIAHRGPDGEGFWINPKKTAALGHCRLAVIDPSPEAAQPMHLFDRYTILYNGELYNYREIRTELQKAGYSFSTTSDTEVILCAFDCYQEKCLNYFDGMFAFIIWDEFEQRLFGARDRFGEKPFFYCFDQDRFLFASEMKALFEAGVPRQLDPRMVINYLVLGQVQHPARKTQTFYKDIFSLPPAHYFVYENQTFRSEPYWAIDKQKTISISEADATEQIRSLLKTAVRRRLRSDIPIGMGISGGLDSSTLLYWVHQAGVNDIQTFSARFPGFEKDESGWIKSITQTFKVSNQTITPRADDLSMVLKKLMDHQEEPIGSSSVLAQYLVYQKAAGMGCRVLLEGQGADEVFAGYPRYIHWYLQEMINRYRFSGAVNERRLLREHQIPFSWGIANWLAAYLPSHVAIALEKKEYRNIMRHTELGDALLEHLPGREWDGLHKPIITKLNDILYFDVFEMGLESLLRYADRNAGAHGAETRLPFLQHELVSFIFSLPSKYKIAHGFPKYILRKSMEGLLPNEIVWRKDKVGYETPQQQWMSDPAVQSLITDSKKKLVDCGYLRAVALNRPVKSSAAYAPDNADWRYLCLAHLL